MYKTPIIQNEDSSHQTVREINLARFYIPENWQQISKCLFFFKLQAKLAS